MATTKPRRSRHLLAWSAAVLCLASACSSGGSPSSGPSGTTDTPAVAHGAFCKDYEERVRLVYTVVSRPTASGNDLAITLTVKNGSERHLLGDVGGAMAVTRWNPGSPSLYAWGDSPNDVVAVRAGTTRRVPISGLGVKPLSVPTGAKVSVLGVWSRLGPSRTGREPCWLPAHVRAPRDLVVGHPGGSWYLSARRGQQLEKQARR